MSGAADHYKAHGYEVENRKGESNELELACTQIASDQSRDDGSRRESHAQDTANNRNIRGLRGSVLGFAPCADKSLQANII